MVYKNLSPKELTEKTLELKQGVLADNGALCVNTGEFTGRSPKDKFIVADAITLDKVFWGDINFKISPEKFDQLHKKIETYLQDRDIFIKDAQVCADKNYRLNIRVSAEFPWQALFAHNLFLRPTKEEIENFKPDWNIISAPGFEANPAEDGTRRKNFTIINFTKKLIIIGGSAYTGEIKKSMFSALNFILPVEKNVLPMHCSANIGKNKDTAIFFGLSGTGKTTLSADPERSLIGDDEHGWSLNSVFNFEGGCYAKCVNLSKEKEPQIWNAVKSGALVENIKFFPNTKTINFEDISKTENTRVAYPIDFIKNAVIPSVGGIPKNIFFLTCDACGILPPISKLTREQAMYYFISGYTAKVAGTEIGIIEPELTFSACFGKAFLPLHPFKYAEMLGKKLEKNNINVWLINTGWSGGAYGKGDNRGKRISLANTRAILKAALDGSLEKVNYEKLSIFNLDIPISCPNVPNEILNPRNTWQDKNSYDVKAKELANSFIKNFEQYKDMADKEILSAGPDRA